MGDTKKAREVLLSKVSKYEEPYQYYLLNQNKGESIRAIARKFGVDDTGLGNYIKKQKSAESAESAHAITNAVEGIKSGLEVIKGFQESAVPRDNQLAQKAIATLEDYYPQMRSIFAGIQNRVLNALDRETQKMEQMGEMDIRGIAQAQAVLKMVNDTNGFVAKTPQTQINIQNNNANINASQSSKQTKNKEIRFVTISSKEDLKKAQDLIEVEVID